MHDGLLQVLGTKANFTAAKVLASMQNVFYGISFVCEETEF